MKRRMILLSLCLLFCTPSVFAAMVYLNSGETLSGRIQAMDEQTLSLESDRGFGVLQIERADIRLIEFDGVHRDMSRKFGVGYYQRGTISGGAGSEYNTGNASMKYWLNNADSLDLLLGYAGTSSGKNKEIEIFNLEMRYAKVALQEGNSNLYWGGSLGYLSVTDNSSKIDDSGTSIRAFVGVEVFLMSLPNIGFSGEIGVGNQTVGKRTSIGIFTAGFPTMAVRYYF